MKLGVNLLDYLIISTEYPNLWEVAEKLVPLWLLDILTILIEIKTSQIHVRIGRLLEPAQIRHA